MMEDCISFLSRTTLRTGLTLELLATLIATIVYYAYGGEAIDTHFLNFRSLPGNTVSGAGVADAASALSKLALPMAVLMIFWIIGAAKIGLFHCFLSLSTNPGQKVPHRFFRAGSRVLPFAVLMDLVAAAGNFAFMAYAAGYGSNTSGLQHFLSQPGVFLMGELMVAVQCVSWLFYGVSFMLMASFGEQDCTTVGLVMSLCYKGSGLLGLISLLLGNDTNKWVMLVSFLLAIVGLIVATIWSFVFEPSVKDDEYEEAPAEYQMGQF